MRRALKLAAKGAGYVSPNPMVGAVLVRDGNIIGSGYHEKFGHAHAEVNAIADAGGNVAGTTLYSTLEPCCHLNKKTPPCAQRIIKEKISRVIIAGTDPNPQVNGQGISMMRQAGIQVQAGLLEGENRELNRFFYKFVLQGMPWVMVKIAQTVDGRISSAAGRQTWITGEKSRREVHKWRTQYDAVIVGAGTVRTDDPQLTVRHYRGRDPLRVILSRSLDLPENTGILTGDKKAGTLIFTTSAENSPKFSRLQDAGVNIRPMRDGTEGLHEVLQLLAGQGVTSVMIEGGQEIFTQFVASGLTDEINVFIGPQIFGSGPAAFGTAGTMALSDYSLYRCKKIADDALFMYRRKSEIV